MTNFLFDSEKDKSIYKKGCITNKLLQQIMSLKILSTLAVVATVAEATNSLRSTQGPPNGGLNHNVQWTVSHNPTYGICDDDNTVLAQVEAGMKGCSAAVPTDRVCGEEECGR